MCGSSSFRVHQCWHVCCFGWCQWGASLLTENRVSMMRKGQVSIGRATPDLPRIQQTWIGQISASDEDRALMFGSYERTLKALSEFYYLVAMVTFSSNAFVSPFVPPMDKTELVRSQLLMKIEHWCLIHMKWLWKHFQNLIIWLLW